MEQFVEYDPEYGEDPREYREMREAEEANALPTEVLDTRSKAKVKLAKTSLKWICSAKPKERTTKSGRTIQYFTQCFFTVRGNRMVLTYDAGTVPMPAGSGKGAVVEIFGRTIDEADNADKTRTIFISGAEVFKTGTRDAGPATAAPARPQEAEKPKDDPAARMRVRVASELRKELNHLRHELDHEDADTQELETRIVDLTIRLARLERGEDPTETAITPAVERRNEPRIVVARDGEEAELRELIADQLADDTGTTGAEIDKAADDAGDEAEILDHDEDGAELTRSTAPWADSSLPVGAGVDGDCWDCPFRLGASCIRQGGCVLD